MLCIFWFSAKWKRHAVHHVAEVEEIISGAGALVRHLPPYSSDFDPIEGGYHH